MAAAEERGGWQQPERPVQLISIDNAGKCHLHEEAVQLLRETPGRLAVVGIAGLYRTGKSYLLNRLLGRQAGFEVGPSVNPCTKGLWIWGRPVQLAPNYHCLLIDTEGLGSAQRTTSCDMQIFSLCILLSSYFVYNSMGAIDEQAIDDLHLVLNLAKHIHARSGSEGEALEPPHYFPSFLWVVRDFHLRLVNEHGSPITERDYLESALQPVPGHDEKNSIRGMIRNLFPQRDCATLVRPVADEADLRRVEQLPYESLRPQFRTQVEAFVNKVYAALKPKQIGNAVVTGQMFASLASQYCTAINNSAVPTIQSAWASAVQLQLRSCLRNAVQEYQRQMSEEVLKHLPMGEAQLRDVHRAAEAEAHRLLEEPGFDEGDPKFAECRAELAEKLRQLRERAEAENAEASRRQCQGTAEELYSELVEGKLSALGSYRSFEELTQDWDRLRAEYLRRTAGPAQADVLSAWLLQRMTESMQRVHDQLRSAADERCGSLQEEHSAALEAERQRHDGSLEKARRQWLSEREELRRRLEAAAHEAEKARRAVQEQESESEAVAWRRTHAMAPSLKEGPVLVQGSREAAAPQQPVHRSFYLPEGAAPLGTVLPTNVRQGQPTAKRLARRSSAKEPVLVENSRSSAAMRLARRGDKELLARKMRDLDRPPEFDVSLDMSSPPARDGCPGPGCCVQ